MPVKAEATPHPAEAQKFTPKAHELMTRHAIDAALVKVLRNVPGGPRPRLFEADLEAGPSYQRRSSVEALDPAS